MAHWGKKNTTTTKTRILRLNLCVLQFQAKIVFSISICELVLFCFFKLSQNFSPITAFSNPLIGLPPGITQLLLYESAAWVTVGIKVFAVWQASCTCRAQPLATASSAFRVVLSSLPKNLLIRSLMAGILVAPPTISTAYISSFFSSGYKKQETIAKQSRLFRFTK